MIPWGFKDYWTEDGRCPIREWYESLETAAQVAFDGTLLRLRGVNDWEPRSIREFRHLEREHAGLGEVRFWLDAKHPATGKTFKRRFRAAGILRPEQRDFLLLVGCEKTGGPHISHSAFDVALEYRRLLLEQRRGEIREHI